MTTQSIKIASQTFTKRASKVRCPYIDQAVGFYLFGTNAASSLTNLAYGAGINLTALATPTYGTGVANISGVNGFDTGLLLDTPYTQIVVAKVTAAAARIAVLGRGAGADANVDMLRLADSASFTVDQWANGAQQNGFDNLQTTNFRFIGARWGGTGTPSGAFAYDTNALYASNSSALTKTTTPTTNLRIGVSNASGGATAQVAAVVLLPFFANPMQIREIYNYLKPLLAARGVTVV